MQNPIINALDMKGTSIFGGAIKRNPLEVNTIMDREDILKRVFEDLAMNTKWISIHRR